MNHRNSNKYSNVDDEAAAAMLVYPTEGPILNDYKELICTVFAGVVTIATIIFTFVAGLNVLPGVSFMKNWTESGNIMYLVLSMVSLVTLWVCSATKLVSHKKRPWQYNQELLYALISYSTAVMVSSIPYAVYSFKVGDVKSFCTDSVCIAGVYFENKLVYGTLFFASFLYLHFAVKIAFILGNTHETVTTIRPVTAKRILEEADKTN